MIAVDTSVWIDFFCGRPTPAVLCLKECLNVEPTGILLVDLVLTEILQGITREADVARVEERLAEFDVLRLQHMADFRAAAGLYRAVRQRGHTIRSTIDCLIAAMCIREDVPLLHSDKDFDRLADMTTLSVVEY
jgi:predicted nucleic acid-binding protein